MSNNTTTIDPSTAFKSAQVMIVWSENAVLNSFACEGKEHEFHDLNKINKYLRHQTVRVLNQICVYCYH